MNPDFDLLVEMVMAGRPGPLQHALRTLSARLRRPLTMEDYPACVRDMFDAFTPFAQANGMPKRGRPLKDPELERMRLVYSKWVESIVRTSYEEKRLWLQIAKANGGGEIVDAATSFHISTTAKASGREVIPIYGKPSDRAREMIATEFGNVDEFGDAKPDAIKKMLRGKVSKKVPRPKDH